MQQSTVVRRKPSKHYTRVREESPGNSSRGSATTVERKDTRQLTVQTRRDREVAEASKASVTVAVRSDT